MSNGSTRPVKEAVARGIARRYRNERIFRALGLAALMIGLGFLAFFFYTLIGNAYTALTQTRIRLIELPTWHWISCRFGRKNRRLMPRTLTPLPPRYFGLPLLTYWLPLEGRLPQISHCTLMIDAPAGWLGSGKIVS